MSLQDDLLKIISSTRTLHIYVQPKASSMSKSFKLGVIPIYDQGAHFTRDISSDVPVLTIYFKVALALVYHSKVNNTITCDMNNLIVE